MRWVRYTVDGRTSFGLVDADRVEEVRGSPFSSYEPSGVSRPLSEVRLLVPVIPRTFYAAGLNYAEHVRAEAARRGEAPQLPAAADIGYRANNALIAHGEPIVIPADASDVVEYEAEIVAVIGRETKNVSEVEALDAVLGFTIGNDVSERTWQRSDRSMWRAKNTDTFKPMGPWIETEFNLDAARTRVRVNGEQTIEFSTNDMLFSIAHYIARMSRYLTLHPGDVIWMGTEGKSPTIAHGDVVEIEITGIGVLRNPVMRADGRRTMS